VTAPEPTQVILAIGDACGPPKKNRGAVAVAEQA